MLGQDQFNGDPFAWLLAPDSPGVRYLALRDLLDVPSDDPELRAAAQAAHTQRPIATGQPTKPATPFCGARFRRNGK
jgi:hypothetical protein